MHSINIFNKRFGRLLALRDAGKTNSGLPLIECLCECGNITVVRKGNLSSGMTKSCGCLQKDRTSDSQRKHSKIRGVTHIPEYATWKRMLGRCRKGQYMERGIAVCEEWRDSFDAFFLHIGKMPTLKHSLDRINNDGNYEPGNVRWATPIEQANNRRTATVPAIELLRLRQNDALLIRYLERFGALP